MGRLSVCESLLKVFKPVIGYSNLLTTEFIPLSDDDTPSEYVKVNILGRYKPPPNQEHTYFYNKNNPEKEIQSFKLSELENEEIYLYQAEFQISRLLIGSVACSRAAPLQRKFEIRK